MGGFLKEVFLGSDADLRDLLGADLDLVERLRRKINMLFMCNKLLNHNIRRMIFFFFKYENSFLFMGRY